MQGDIGKHIGQLETIILGGQFPWSNEYWNTPFSPGLQTPNQYYNQQLGYDVQSQWPTMSPWKRTEAIINIGDWDTDKAFTAFAEDWEALYQYMQTTVSNIGEFFSMR